jgi:hypothetical protein
MHWSKFSVNTHSSTLIRFKREAARIPKDNIIIAGTVNLAD